LIDIGKRRLGSALAVAAVAAVCIPGAGARQPEPARLVGQTLMTGFAGPQPSASLLGRIRRGEVGGVILFRGNLPSEAAARVLVQRLQAAAAAGGNPRLLVAVDQEGGPVRRLDGPPEDPPAGMTNAGQAAAEGAAAGTFLRRVGINVDLAPVLDTPTTPGSFLGTRAFGRDPRRNARLGSAFVRGVQRQGVAATAKHFPGLGTAGANTDSSHVWITTPKAGLDARLVPFAAALKAGVELVMMSNAGYRAYDPSGLPAVLSRRIVTGLLRERLGFDGVVITDAMSAPGPSGRTLPSVKALAAGVDVLLYTSEAGGRAAYDELLAAARSGELSLRKLEAANRRIAALKRRLAG
jgi:beta-N-acetylhexosaminidase